MAFIPDSHGGDEVALGRQLGRVAAASPQSFGYLRNYWREAKRGLDNVDRSYAQASRVHAAIPDPESTTRSLGYTLTLLAALDVVAVETERSNSTIYDLEAYDASRLLAVGALLDDWDSDAAALGDGAGADRRH